MLVLAAESITFFEIYLAVVFASGDALAAYLLRIGDFFQSFRL